METRKDDRNRGKRGARRDFEREGGRKKERKGVVGGEIGWMDGCVWA